MSVRGSKPSSFFSAFSSYLLSGYVSKCKMKSSEGLSIAVSNQYPEIGFQSSLSQKSDNDLHVSDSNHAAIDDGIRKELENLDVKYCNETEDITFGGEEAEDGGKREVGEGGGNGDEKIEENCMKENDDEDGREDESDRENLSGGGDENDDDEVEKNVERNGKKYLYPVRPDAEDCAYYLKNGTCKFGPSCKFNHPIRSKNQATKGKLKDHEDSSDKRRHTECKFYSKTGGCKFGKACRYNHTRAKISVGPVLELNFMGLPIRPDEKKCPYFMRTGSCKYGPNCKFNHPDPIAVDASETSSGYENGGSGSLHILSQPPISSWSSLRMVNETAPFVPVMLTPAQPQEWNGYQAPVYPSVPPPSYPMSNPATEAHDYKPQHQHMQVEDFPERPGYPECSYFMKTGDCKFKSKCKYHHPKQSAPCNLSNKGLPLRPEQNVCSYYSRYGICKFGPACKFNHPINLSTATGFGGNDQHPHYGNSNSSTETAIIYGGGGDNAYNTAVSVINSGMA